MSHHSTQHLGVEATRGIGHPDRDNVMVIRTQLQVRDRASEEEEGRHTKNKLLREDQDEPGKAFFFPVNARMLIRLQV